MASAGSVTVDFDARSARFAAELEKVRSSLQKLEGNTASVAKAFAVLPSLLSAGAVIAYGKAMFEAADAIGDAAARSGVAVESLSRLKFIAEQSDVEFSSLTVGIKNFQKGLSEASSGSASAIQSFARIGVEAEKIRNLPLEQQLIAIAAGFERVRNPADQTRIAMDLFGKAGAELVPFLQQGPKGLADLANEADRLGITLNGQTIGAIGAADQALKKLKATVDSFFQRALGDIALAIMGPGALSQIDQLKLQLRSLNEEKQRIELSGAPEGSGFAARLVEIGTEAARVAEQLRILEAIDSYKTISGRGGRGRPGGGGNPNSAPGQGGQFIPFKAGEGDTGSSGLRLDDFLSPEARQQLLDELNTISRVSREMDYQDFLDTEYFKRRAAEDTWKKQVEGAQWAAEQEQQTRLTTANLALGLLNTLAGKSKAAAIAAVLLNRGLAISQAVQNTAVAVTKALTVDPTGALAARVATLGKIQIGIIAATGALEIGNIVSGNAGGIGGTTLGTPSNPLPTTDVSTATGATSRTATTVIFNGPVTERDALVQVIRDAINDDVIVIPTGSRQAMELRGGL